jgi:protocatechuate 3,4-dioxygenase, alpha subunit
MNKYQQTPSQTVGPYFAYGLTPEQYLFDFKSLATNILDDSGVDSISLSGRIFDGAGQVISDAMVEIWDAENKLFGRFGTGTRDDSSFIFQTIKPKAQENQAPFLSLILFMRGQLVHSYTRIYFENEEANDQDEVLKSIPTQRRDTIIAKKSGDNYVFDIYMQGENETIFFDI